MSVLVYRGKEKERQKTAIWGKTTYTGVEPKQNGCQLFERGTLHSAGATLAGATLGPQPGPREQRPGPQGFHSFLTAGQLSNAFRM